MVDYVRFGNKIWFMTKTFDIFFLSYENKMKLKNVDIIG